jgi:hypothetical protein
VAAGRCRRWLAAGAGVGTLGLAEMWAFSQVWAHHPWQARLLPAMGLAALAAVAAAVLGGAFARIVDHRRPASAARVVLAAFAGLLVAVSSRCRGRPPTRPSGSRPPRPARAWSTSPSPSTRPRPSPAPTGGRSSPGRAWAAPTNRSSRSPRAATSPRPVPVGGSWKTMVRVADGPYLGAVPIALPADPEYDQPAIPLQDVREQPFQFQDELMLREQQDGPPGRASSAAC